MTPELEQTVTPRSPAADGRLLRDYEDRLAAHVVRHWEAPGRFEVVSGGATAESHGSRDDAVAAAQRIVDRELTLLLDAGVATLSDGVATLKLARGSALAAGAVRDSRAAPDRRASADRRASGGRRDCDGPGDFQRLRAALDAAARLLDEAAALTAPRDGDLAERLAHGAQGARNVLGDAVGP
jgi:hypothetical protein